VTKCVTLSLYLKYNGKQNQSMKKKKAFFFIWITRDLALMKRGKSGGQTVR